MNIENYKIRQFRKALKLRQEDLAKEIKVSTQLIRMYENGTRNPSSEKKKEICKFFSISLNELEGGKDKEQLKLELQEQISTFNLTINKYQVLKISLLKKFAQIVNNELDIQSLLENTHKNTYLKQLEQYILNFILKHYICESIFTSTCYNEDILKHNNKEINELLTNFIKSNIRFVESTIEELYYKEDSKHQIPIIKNVIYDWNDLITNAKEYTQKMRRMDKKDIKLFVILTLVVVIIISFFVFGDIGKNKKDYTNYREEKQEYEQEEKASLITYMKVSNEKIINQGTSYKYPSYYFVGELKNTYTKAIKGAVRATFYNGTSIVHTETILLPNDGLSAGETFNFESYVGNEDFKYTNIKYSDYSLRTKY